MKEKEEYSQMMEKHQQYIAEMYQIVERPATEQEIADMKEILASICSDPNETIITCFPCTMW